MDRGCDATSVQKSSSDMLLLKLLIKSCVFLGGNGEWLGGCAWVWMCVCVCVGVYACQHVCWQNKL